MPRKVDILIPDEWEKTWLKLLKLYNLKDHELVLELIKDEVAVIAGERERKAYERMEAAAKEVNRNLGAECLDQFSREVELLAKKLVEGSVK